MRRPELARLAFVRPAFDEGVRFAVEGVRLAFVRPAFDEGVRFAVEGVFDRFVDPERAGLERVVRPLEREAPPRDPPRR